MDMLFTDTEFFTHEGEVWYRRGDDIRQLTERDTEMVEAMVEHISTFYPGAYSALREVYRGSALNQRYYRFRMVARFVRCNFAPLDNVPDAGAGGFRLEYVACPLRGECRHERVICRPEYDHRLSAAELPVMQLWSDGLPEEAIGERLCLSPHTVHNHIRNAYRRLGVHSRAELVRYAAKHNLFS